MTFYIDTQSGTEDLTPYQVRKLHRSGFIPADFSEVPERFKPLTEVAAPVQAGKVAVRAPAVQVAGVWTQQWTLRDETPEEAAAIANAARLAELRDEVEGDAALTALRNATNAQIDAYFAANVTNAAQAIQMLKRLTKAVARSL